MAGLILPTRRGIIAPTKGPLATLNPADTASYITLSNGNLTATRNNTLGDFWKSARCTVPKTIGKYYFEVKVVNTLAGSTNGVAIGLANSTFKIHTNTTTQDYVGDDLNSVGIDAWYGTMKYNATNQDSVDSWANASKVLGVAVDLNARKIWARLQGMKWNTRTVDDPASNIGGLSLPTGLSSDPVYVAISLYQSGLPDAITLNFGQSSFVGPVPTGFTTWN